MTLKPLGVINNTYTNVVGGAGYTNDLKPLVDGVMFTGGYVMLYPHGANNFYTYDANGNITGLGAEATSRGLVAGDELTTASTVERLWVLAQIQLLLQIAW